MREDWIHRILSRRVLSSTSQAQYARCLVYWDTWHRLRYEGRPLPLAQNPPFTVGNSVLRDFAHDHLAQVAEGTIGCRMNDAIAHALRAQGFNRRGSGLSGVTSRWRLDILVTAHRTANLSVDRDLVNQLQEQLQAAWASARIVTGAPSPTVPSARDFVAMLRRACPDNRDGVRATALVTLLQILTVRQVVQLKFGDLIPGYIGPSNDLVRVVDIYIRHPVNRFQVSEPFRRLEGDDAEAVTLWGSVRVYDTMGEDYDRAPAETPFFVRDIARSGRSVPITYRWVSATVQQLARWAGVPYNDGKTRCSGGFIRKNYEREFREELLLVRIAARLGLKSTRSALRIMDRTRRY